MPNYILVASAGIPLAIGILWATTPSRRFFQKLVPKFGGLGTPSFVAFKNLLRRRFRIQRTLSVAMLIVAVIAAGQVASAQIETDSLQPLNHAAVPKPSNLRNFVKNEEALVRLGKALFWDIQIGSDGKTSCASCHFHAGADNRSRNQLSPGLLQVARTDETREDGEFVENPDTTVQLGGLNYQLKPRDFPFHKLSNPNRRGSTVLADTNDVASSQGVHNSIFDQQTGESTPEPDEVFNIHGINVRKVEPRNTPSVINAVFNFRNFWDGRAQENFNGVNPFGKRDSSAVVLKRSREGELEPTQISLNNSSLASQAVGPPISAFEMSAEGRTFSDIGRRARKRRAKAATRMLSLRPLAKQAVASDDSVLGPISRELKNGLNVNYRRLIRDAFRNKWWNSDTLVALNDEGDITFVDGKPLNQAAPNEFSQMEFNFSLFFGLAVQAYEATLISDDTPVDRYLAGDSSALTRSEIRGMEVFETKGKCISCHAGPELTKASVANVKNQPLERMVMANDRVAVYDNGFYNIGVRPTTEDLGVGGKDPFGNPLSMTELEQQQGRPFPVVPGEDPAPTRRLRPNERTAVNGAFKTPGLRNIALTAPYFHNGGQLTLEQVVDFYNRGGDFRNNRDRDPDIERLGLTNREKKDLVAFMEALTDERVIYDRAPFDHPELPLPNGQRGNESAVKDNDGDGQAEDRKVVLPAVGKNGWTGSPNFLNQPIPVRTSATIEPTVDPSPLGGGISPQDANCPAGTTYVALPGGYICQ
ncbi:MAG: cytochrome C peroxidase [Leptolyngbya sp. SIO4C5]|nr:cytochrome C peroxidase [Leptolyngbya sp. SIO4C5]